MLVQILLHVADHQRERLAAAFAIKDAVVTCSGGNPPWDQIDPPECDLIVVSPATLPEDFAGRVGEVRAFPSQPEVIAVTETEDAQHQAALLAAGCLAVIPIGLPDESLREVIAAVIARYRETAIQVSALERAQHALRLGDFITLSPKMRNFMTVAQRVARSDTSVLVLGETGVGKERLARALHSESKRAGGPFVVVNCGAIPETLMESELFGHEKGSFTGASRAHRGYFEMAHGGTIFLDEIGEMPSQLQVRLLRVIQDREVQRVGGEVTLPVDVRLLAATNRDIEAEVASTQFRADLYYRLSVVTLTIPPLRDRVEDIAPLVRSYVGQFRSQMVSPVRRIHPDAIAALERYPWPGNVRELMNVVERAVLLCLGEEISPADLPEGVLDAVGLEPSPQLLERAAVPLNHLDESWLRRPLAEAKQAWNTAFERSYLSALLEATHGRIGETAERAGIDPRSLYTKMRRHGLRKEDFRGGQKEG